MLIFHLKKVYDLVKVYKTLLYTVVKIKNVHLKISIFILAAFSMEIKKPASLKGYVKCSL